MWEIQMRSAQIQEDFQHLHKSRRDQHKSGGKKKEKKKKKRIVTNLEGIFSISIINLEGIFSIFIINLEGIFSISIINLKNQHKSKRIFSIFSTNLEKISTEKVQEHFHQTQIIKACSTSSLDTNVEDFSTSLTQIQRKSAQRKSGSIPIRHKSAQI